MAKADILTRKIANVCFPIFVEFFEGLTDEEAKSYYLIHSSENVKQLTEVMFQKVAKEQAKVFDEVVNFLEDPLKDLGFYNE